MQMLRYPMILTTFQFTYVPTQPMAMRPVQKVKACAKKLINRGDVDKKSKFPSDLDASRMFPNFEARKRLHFPAHRQFDPFQIMTYKDAIFQPNRLDKVTMFGLRCPELRWIKRLPKYLTYFVFERMSECDNAKDCDMQTQCIGNVISNKSAETQWMDAMGR